MIELVISALLQIATITSDASATTTTQDAANTTTATTTAYVAPTPTPGGVGSWDDEN